MPIYRARVLGPARADISVASGRRTDDAMDARVMESIFGVTMTAAFQRDQHHTYRSDSSWKGLLLPAQQEDILL